jgi:hypothetical protein
VERGDSWIVWLAEASDRELDAFADELTETLPADDPMIGEVREVLRRFRDALRSEGGVISLDGWLRR